MIINWHFLFYWRLSNWLKSAFSTSLSISDIYKKKSWIGRKKKKKNCIKEMKELFDHIIWWSWIVVLLRKGPTRVENEKSPKTARERHVESIGRRYKYNETESLCFATRQREQIQRCWIAAQNRDVTDTPLQGWPSRRYSVTRIGSISVVHLKRKLFSLFLSIKKSHALSSTFCPIYNAADNSLFLSYRFISIHL